MPADESYDVALDKNKIDDATRYGCFNRPAFTDYYYTLSRVYFDNGMFETQMVEIENKMSRECRYDMSLCDVRCVNCDQQGNGERYANSIRAAAK